MKVKQIPLALALALAMGAVASGPAQDAGHAHHTETVAHAAGTDFPVPERHVAWAPDAPLVEGMSRVRTAIAALEQQADAAAVAARADDVDATIGFMRSEEHTSELQSLMRT